MSDIKPVYPEYHKDGLRLQLMSDGSVRAWTKDIAPHEVAQLGNKENGTPWIPKHKNFNSLCRQMIREGDFDDLISRQRVISEQRGMKRKAGVELYEALAAFEQTQDLWLPDEVAEEHVGEAEALHTLRRKMIDALAKARGE